MTVLCHGVRGGRSSPQVNAGSTTAASGANAALSRASNERSASGVADRVAEHLVSPANRTRHRLRVWIHDNFVGIETVPACGFVRAVYAVTVELVRAGVRQKAVPDHVGLLRQRDARSLA